MCCGYGNSVFINILMCKLSTTKITDDFEYISETFQRSDTSSKVIVVKVY